MRYLLAFFACLLLVAPNTTIGKEKKPVRMPGDMRFSEYTGQDKFDWETSAGSLADTSYDLPVYRSWPSKPFAVLGEIYNMEERKEWREGELKDAVQGAKRVGGEAIIIKLISESGVGAITGSVGGGLAAGRPGVLARTTAMVIRWQTESEKEARRARDNQLQKQLLADYPNLEVNSETSALVVKYLLQSSQGEVTQDLFSRYEEIMTKVSAQSDGQLSGNWVFKGTIKEKGMVSEKETQFLGLASLSTDGESIAIVSTEGKVEMSFSGLNAKGRLSGQAGVGGFSSKADGVALEGKISLSFQTLTPDGTAHGVVVLQRNKTAPLSKPKVNQL